MNPLWSFDRSVFRAINIDLHRDWLDPWFMIFSYSGLGQVIALAIFALLIWRETRRFFWPLILSLALSGFVVADGLKALMARDRPSNMTDAIRQEAWLANSFPSGHSAAAFGVAFMLVILTWKKDTAWVGWVALLWAFLVGISRIYRGVHWPTDVLAGMFAGLASAAAVHLGLKYLGSRDITNDVEAGVME